MRKFFFVLLGLLLFSGLANAYPVWLNSNATYREIYNITAKGSANTTAQLLHVTFANQTNTLGYPVMNFSRATASTNVSVAYRFLNGSEIPLYGSNQTACSYWEAFGYVVNKVQYASLWVKVPSLPTTANYSQLVIYEGTNSGSGQYNETCVFQSTQSAYLFDKNAGAVTLGFNSNGQNNNASDSNTASANWTIGGQSLDTSTSPKYLNSSYTNNATSGAYLAQVTVLGSFANSYLASDLTAGFASLGYIGATYGCVFNDGAARTAVTADSNFKNGSTYSLICFWNNSVGGAGTQNLTFLVNGAYNASSVMGTIAGVAQTVRVGAGSGLTTSPAYLSSFILMKSASNTINTQSWYANVYDSTLQYSSSEFGSDLIQIYYPSNTTYYNVSNQNLIWSINSTLNASSLKSWSIGSGLSTYIGVVANATVNTTSPTSTNGQNSYGIFTFNNYGNGETYIWPAEEGSGTNVEDKVSNNNLTLNSGVSWSGAANAFRNNALNFSETSMGAESSSAVMGKWSAYTVCSWVWPAQYGVGITSNNTIPRVFDADRMTLGVTNSTRRVFYQVNANTTTNGLTALNQKAWSFVCALKNSTHDWLWVNGAVDSVYTSDVNPLTTTTNAIMVGQNVAQNRAWSGMLGRFYAFNTTLSQNELLALYNLNDAVYSNATVYWTQTNGLNITAYNSTQASSTILSGLSVTVSTASNSSTTTGDSNLVIDTRTIPNSATVNVSVTKSGYAPRVLENVVYSNASALYTVSAPLCRYQELRLNGTSNTTAVTTWSAVIYGTGSNVSTYSTTNGSIYFSWCDVPLGSFTVEVLAAGYNSTNTTFNLNTTSEINYTITSLESGIIIYAFDEASCASSCQRIYLGVFASNGTSTTSNYSLNYFINSSYTAFPQGTVTLTINNSVNGTYYPRDYLVTISSTSTFVLNTYLLNQTGTTISATYCTITSANSPIGGSTITIQRLFGSSYVTVAQTTTGSDGCAVFYLDSTVTYQVVATASGYSSLTVTGAPRSIQYLVLSSSNVVLGFLGAYHDSEDIIETILQPLDSALSLDWVLVNFTIYSYNSTLTNWGMLCDYNGTTIYNVNVTTSPSGGSTTTNITITNKTVAQNGTGSFFCYGLFDRTGYNTTFINRTYYLNYANTSFTNSSVSGGIDAVNQGAFSTQFLTIMSIVATAVITAGLAPFVPVGAGIISSVVLSGFAFFGWLEPLPFILFLLVSLAYQYFNSRQF